MQWRQASGRLALGAGHLMPCLAAAAGSIFFNASAAPSLTYSSPLLRAPRTPAAPLATAPRGAAPSARGAWAAQAAPPAAARPPPFPPEDRHQVLVLATTKPADRGVPTSHWSLEDLAYHILRDAHY